jgi:hypothetical protein
MQGTYLPRKFLDPWAMAKPGRLEICPVSSRVPLLSLQSPREQEVRNGGTARGQTAGTGEELSGDR